MCFMWAGVKSQLRALEELSHRVDTIVNASTADDILKVRRLDSHATMSDRGNPWREASRYEAPSTSVTTEVGHTSVYSHF